MKALLSILLVLFVSSNSFAQSLSFSRVGSISQLPGGGYVASIASSFNNSVDCIKLNTGVSLFGSILNRNEFSAACRTSISEGALEFNLFPNPVVNYTRLVAYGLSPSANSITIVIVDALGRTFLKEQLAPRVLIAGYSMHLSRLMSGNYFIRVYGDGFSRVIPLVKVQ